MKEQFDKSYIRELAHKWKLGILSKQERELLESWDRSQPDGILKLEENTDPNEILNRLLVKVGTEIKKEKADQHKETKLWPRFVAVAAAVGLIVFGVNFFNQDKPGVDKNEVAVVQDLAPGKVGATLTLASGKTIRLEDAVNGELATEAGISINKTADGKLVYEIKDSATDPNKINTLSTANGETYQVHLPDGSMVYLNAASSLTYAASLIERGKRTVRLSGEGYFEIAKDKKHPFVVQTKGQRVEVLGTHFNINAYTDESSIKTTLLEGSVKIEGRLILKPGEQSEISRDRVVSVNKVNTAEAIAWKNGVFSFNEASLETVMRQMGRWYDVEIVYPNGVPDRKFTGDMDRNLTAAKALSLLQFMKVKFKIDGKKIIVTK